MGASTVLDRGAEAQLEMWQLLADEHGWEPPCSGLPRVLCLPTSEAPSEPERRRNAPAVPFAMLQMLRLSPA
jgi:hypothetical protein